MPAGVAAAEPIDEADADLVQRGVSARFSRREMVGRLSTPGGSGSARSRPMTCAVSRRWSWTTREEPPRAPPPDGAPGVGRLHDDPEQVGRQRHFSVRRQHNQAGTEHDRRICHLRAPCGNSAFADHPARRARVYTTCAKPARKPTCAPIRPRSWPCSARIRRWRSRRASSARRPTPCMPRWRHPQRNVKHGAIALRAAGPVGLPTEGTTAIRA